ncbi:hypothetical protein HK099_008357 [Clydaea vesicula]|uniref:Uncharacterized protein n=1 Tax=Clydaea vesicula TaxID=447962 RepID=A0AAD5XXZ7_9FUNG|nr:hypothetical protein HK099_008357 [Clydaea vesicula]
MKFSCFLKRLSLLSNLTVNDYNYLNQNSESLLPKKRLDLNSSSDDDSNLIDCGFIPSNVPAYVIPSTNLIY